ncbi:Pkr1 domain-containing protein [Phanerochaete sordida]|uniref:Pkr1 domain-containing protein n=1 Tax=Phanerochaete sordida TaxID=48140 RepID=A0A9P3FYZ2_9APHY|nr:Pkr1 domain-containing protein [Phanerochaete sordida]
MSSDVQPTPQLPHQQTVDTNAGLVSQLLTPGSSLHPTFLVVLDVAFAALLCVFLGLLAVTGGNIHILVLIVIEGCLYASVKWFVAELQRTVQPTEPTPDKKKEE